MSATNMVIEGVAVSTDRSVRSSVAHAGRAGRECLASAGLSPADVDLMIHVGIYRDDNMVEPAMAAMIQKEIGINLDYVKSETPKAVASFDLMNGACGALNAVQVASAFVATGSARRVLVVSSDAHPSNRTVAGFPFATMGGAMLLVQAEQGGGRGFDRVQLRQGEASFVGLEGAVPWKLQSRTDIQVRVHPEYSAYALDFASRSAREYAEAERVDLRRTYLVSSHPTMTFARDLAKSLGIADDAVTLPHGIEADPHSSALAWGYREVLARAVAPRYEAILFVAIGSGMSSGCALYRL